MVARVKKSGPIKNLKDKNIDKAYEKYRDGLPGGPNTRPSMPGNWRNPMVNSLNVIPRKPSKAPPKPPTGGGSTKRAPKMGGGGGGIRIGLRRGIGDR